MNTLIALEEKGFPEPLFESTGEKRHSLRLWWWEDIEKWSENRPSSSSSSTSAKSKSKKGATDSGREMPFHNSTLPAAIFLEVTGELG